MNSLEKLDDFHLSVFMQIFENPKLRNSFNLSLRSRFPQTWKYINERYLQLNGHKFGEKCWWLMNRLEDFPRCPVCKSSMDGKYLSIFDGYSLTCSQKCGKIYSKTKYE